MTTIKYKILNFFKRIDIIKLLTIEWSIERSYFGVTLFSIGLWHKWDGKSNYSTKSFAWLSYFNRSWHCGFLFFKIK